MNDPIDWDGVSFCTDDTCHRPATHQVFDGMVDNVPKYDLLCCQHAGLRP